MKQWIFNKQKITHIHKVLKFWQLQITVSLQFIRLFSFIPFCCCFFFFYFLIFLWWTSNRQRKSNSRHLVWYVVSKLDCKACTWIWSPFLDFPFTAEFVLSHLLTLILVHRIHSFWLVCNVANFIYYSIIRV